jgi:hypothetical protein
MDLKCPPHSWDGPKCSTCGLERPVRPPGFKPQPIAIEPTKADQEEAAAVARLIGYLNALLPSEALHDAISLNILNGIGEVIVWQIAAWGESEFLRVAQQAVRESEAMPRQRLRVLCSQGFPTLLKHRHFVNDSDNKTLERVARNLAEADARG